MQTVWGASKLYYESCVNGESFHFQARLILKGHGQLMHMRIRYHFLADCIGMSQDTRVKQKAKSVSVILKTNLEELN